MKKIGIVAKPSHIKSSEIVGELCDWFKKKGITVLLEADTAEMLAKTKYYSKSDLPSMVDMIVVLGGDGTLLSVARQIKCNDMPILGVNLGSLGFLTVLTLDEMYPALENVLEGEFELEKRMMLSVETIRDKKIIERHIVFNDAVINRGELARIINLDISINGQYATRYRSDGLIISTPTGSTAYSLAAGGPIVYPTMDAVILSPICPHTLTNRPIVVPGNVKLEVTLTTKTEHVLLTLDGQEGVPLRYLDRIHVKKAKNSLKLIQFNNKNHYTVLSKKLHWGK